MERSSILLFFGSFNPIHRGHLAVARWVVEQGLDGLGRRLCDELWLVVSPGNPLKEAGQLAVAEQRVEMARLAVAASGLAERVKVCDVELRMPRPSYTIDTLERLGREFPDRRFSLLVGSDIVGQLPLWKEPERLVESYPVLIYPRPGYAVSGPFAGKVMVLEGAPTWDYSSTAVREALGGGEAENGMASACEAQTACRGDGGGRGERDDERLRSTGRTDAKPRAEQPQVELCRGAKEEDRRSTPGRGARSPDQPTPDDMLTPEVMDYIARHKLWTGSNSNTK